MRDLSLSLSEAKLLSSDYQHLVGNMLTVEPTDFSIIECVTVAPYDEVNKWIFANRYIDGKQPIPAIDFYECPYFDVLLFARSTTNPDNVMYISLHNYLQQKEQLLCLAS